MENETCLDGQGGGEVVGNVTDGNSEGKQRSVIIFNKGGVNRNGLTGNSSNHQFIDKCGGELGKVVQFW